MTQHWFRHPAVIAVTILILSWILYSPSIGFPFTNWDDDIHVTENHDIQQFSWDHAAHLFVPTSKYMYHPLTMLSYMVDWHSSGGDPVSFHRTNVALHLANIVLLFVLLRRLGIDDALSVFSVALFAFHPVQVESVAWISARKELLYAFFFLLSLLCYLQWHQKRKLPFLAASFLFFLFSLLAKPTAVTLPALILVVHAIGERRTIVKSFYALIPFFAAAIGFSIFLVGLNESGSMFPIEYYQPLQRVFLTLFGISFYLWKAAYPVQLSACYSYPPVDIPPFYFMMTATVIAVVSLIIFFSKSRRGTIAGLTVFVITILPVLQIIPFHNASLVADRYAYLPLIGIALFVGYGFRSLVVIDADESVSGVWMKRTILISGIVILFLLSAERIFVWKGSIELFSDVIEKNPDLPLGYGNRGNAKLAKGNYFGAIQDFDLLLTLKPDDGRALYNQGNAYLELQQFDTALQKYTSAIEKGFTSPSLYYNRGKAHFHRGRIEDALQNYSRATELDPTFADSYYSIGYILLTARKNPAAAINFFDSVIELKKDDANAYYYRAVARFALEDHGEALDDLTRAIVLKSDYENTPLVHQLDSAIAITVQRIDTLTAIINRTSENPSTYRLRGMLYRRLGDSLRARFDEERINSVVKERRYE